MSYNCVILMGNLGNDAIHKNTGSTLVTNMSIATNHGYGENKKTHWHNLVFFGKPAILVSKLKKGDRIHIQGRLENRKWTDQQTNITREQAVVVVQEFEIITGELCKLEEGGKQFDEGDKKHEAVNTYIDNPY